MMVLSLAVSGFSWSNPSARSTASGNQQYEQSQYEAALRAYRDAQLNDPESPELHYNLGNGHYQLEQYDEAMDELVKTLVSDDPELQQHAYYNMGNAHFRQGKWLKAIESYQRALELDPDDVDAKHNIELIRQLIKQNAEQQSPEQQQQSQQQQQSSSQSQGAQGTQNQTGQQGPEDQGDQGDQSSQTPDAVEAAQDPSDEQGTVGQEAAEDTASDPTDQGEDSEGDNGEGDSSDQVAAAQQSTNDDMSREDAQRILDAIGDQEAEQLKRVHQTPQGGPPRVEKPW